MHETSAMVMKITFAHDEPIFLKTIEVAVGGRHRHAGGMAERRDRDFLPLLIGCEQFQKHIEARIAKERGSEQGVPFHPNLARSSHELGKRDTIGPTAWLWGPAALGNALDCLRIGALSFLGHSNDRAEQSPHVIQGKRVGLHYFPLRMTGLSGRGIDRIAQVETLPTFVTRRSISDVFARQFDRAHECINATTALHADRDMRTSGHRDGRE